MLEEKHKIIKTDTQGQVNVNSHEYSLEQGMQSIFDGTQEHVYQCKQGADKMQRNNKYIWGYFRGGGTRDKNQLNGLFMWATTQ